MAIEKQNMEIIKILLKYGADSNTKLSNGNTIFMEAIRNTNNIEIIKC